MGEIGKDLATWRKEVMHLTQEALATRLGISRGHLASMETAQYAISSDVMKSLTKMGFRRSEVSEPSIPASQLLIPIPYIGVASAAAPVNWTDPFESDTFEYVPPEMGDVKGRFSCRVDGDSMYDLLWPGDLVVFQRSDIPKIGHVTLFRSFDNLITIKLLKHDGRQFMLHALNPSYDPVEAKGSALGYLVGIVRQHGNRRVTVYDSGGITP